MSTEANWFPVIYSAKARYRGSSKVHTIRLLETVPFVFTSVDPEHVRDIQFLDISGQRIGFWKSGSDFYRPILDPQGRVALISVLENASAGMLTGSGWDPASMLWEDHPSSRDLSFRQDDDFKFAQPEGGAQDWWHQNNASSWQVRGREAAMSRLFAKLAGCIRIGDELHRPAPLPGSVVEIDGKTATIRTWIEPFFRGNRAGIFFGAADHELASAYAAEIAGSVVDLRVHNPGKIMDDSGDDADMATLKSAAFTIRRALGRTVFANIDPMHMRHYATAVDAIRHSNPAGVSAALASLSELKWLGTRETTLGVRLAIRQRLLASKDIFTAMRI